MTAARDLEMPSDLADDMRQIVSAAHESAGRHGKYDQPRMAQPRRETQREDESDRALRERFDRLERWGVPYRETLLILDQDPAGEVFRETEAIGFAREFLGKADRGLFNVLVLSGLKGTGKTVAGVFIMERAEPPIRFGRTWAKPQHPRFEHVTDLVMLGLYSDQERAQAMSNAKVLLVDDLGAEFADTKGLFLSFLDWLLNRRYESAGYTVLTTNLSHDDFTARYGERIGDRLRQRAAWYDIEHESLRAAPNDE